MSYHPMNIINNSPGTLSLMIILIAQRILYLCKYATYIQPQNIHTITKQNKGSALNLLNSDQTQYTMPHRTMSSFYMVWYYSQQKGSFRGLMNKLILICCINIFFYKCWIFCVYIYLKHAPAVARSLYMRKYNKSAREWYDDSSRRRIFM